MPRHNPVSKRQLEGPIYILEVYLYSGPVWKNFTRKNKAVSRTIQILSGQTLEDLHGAIFDAFDRFDEHMYEFQFGGKGPRDPRARRYVLSGGGDEMDDIFSDRKPAGTVEKTAIGALGLKVGDAFGYWFDFGDDWWHQVNVAAIEEGTPTGTYPRVTQRVGDSPPQYPDEEA